MLILFKSIPPSHNHVRVLSKVTRCEETVERKEINKHKGVQDDRVPVKSWPTEPEVAST